MKMSNEFYTFTFAEGNKSSKIISTKPGLFIKIEGAYYVEKKIGDKLSHRYTMANNNKEGTEEDYYLNGKIKSLRELKNGNPIGSETIFYENEQIQSQCEYSKEGLIIGLYRKRYETGGLHFITTYNENGKENGLREVYYECGKLDRSIEFCNGHFHGYYKIYYPLTEKLKACYKYNMGKRDGPQIEYNQDGSEKLINHYVYGYLVNTEFKNLI